MRIQIYDVVFPANFREKVKEEIDSAINHAMHEEEGVSVRFDFTDNVITKDFYFRLSDLISFEEDVVAIAGDDIRCLKVNIAGDLYKVVYDENVVEIFNDELND